MEEGAETPEKRNEGILSPQDLELEETRRIDRNRHVVPIEEELSKGSSTKKHEGVFETRKAYGITANIRTPDGETSFELSSNDVTEFFDEFLRWYLKQIASGEAPEDALRVLVESSSF